MCFRNLQLAGDAEKREEDDHGAAAGREPEGACNAVAIAHESRSQHGCTPQPGLPRITVISDHVPDNGSNAKEWEVDKQDEKGGAPI